ncbi:hypothetical protein AAG570_008636 [Ranatra chinensis]|uniref:Uncharacterized protein n=1 Tax=Ranatra chinensis TaxID=642074 RepID=A0ABD0YRF8_9HEMI
MASERRNVFYKNKKQQTCKLPSFRDCAMSRFLYYLLFAVVLAVLLGHAIGAPAETPEEVKEEEEDDEGVARSLFVAPIRPCPAGHVWVKNSCRVGAIQKPQLSVLLNPIHKLNALRLYNTAMSRLLCFFLLAALLAVFVWDVAAQESHTDKAPLEEEDDEAARSIFNAPLRPCPPGHVWVKNACRRYWLMSLIMWFRRILCWVMLVWLFAAVSAATVETGQQQEGAVTNNGSVILRTLITAPLRPCPPGEVRVKDTCRPGY